MVAEPTAVTTRMYDVGFGDCVLLSFSYDEDPAPDGVTDRPERHMLIDFGTTRNPYQGFKMDRVADRLKVRTGGKLDVLIATHRHKDHVSGFGQSGSGATIGALNPGLVIRPWPDHPDADDSTVGPFDEADALFAKQLRGAHEFSKQAFALYSQHDQGARRIVREIAEIGLPNEKAIDNLVLWGAKTPRYVGAGDKLDFEHLIPGVSFDVLGPPNLSQVPKLTTQSSDSAEYWMDGAAKLAGGLIGRKTFDHNVFEILGGLEGEGAAAWLVRQLESRTTDQVLQIARSFDDALNNTSIVGLIRAGKTSMLISGDAQIENWQYTLNRIKPDSERDGNEPANFPEYDENLREALANVSLYKIGHHGSRNGTPRSIHNLWLNHRDMRRTMTFLMSTKAGVHGHGDTGVPSPNLETAFSELGKSRMYSTEDLRNRKVRGSSDPESFRAWSGTTSRTSGSFRQFEPEDPY